MSDEVVYVCMKTVDFPKVKGVAEPYVPCLTGKCKVCGEQVSYSKYVYENDEIVKKAIDSGSLTCIQCAMKNTKPEDKVKIPEVALQEIDEYMKKRGKWGVAL